eukprot:7668440-Alexandrium_andersonii.AAC.1
MHAHTYTHSHIHTYTNANDDNVAMRSAIVFDMCKGRGQCENSVVAGQLEASRHKDGDCDGGDGDGKE